MSACMKTSSHGPQRAYCERCLRPASACFCHCITRLASNVELLILQHPEEVGHAKNTGRLLHLCLPNSRLEVGEQWPQTHLQALLHEGDTQPVRSMLLYPPTAPDPQLPLIQPPALPATWLEKPAQLRLVVLDATWRKSRKMLYLNPALQQLPRYALRGDFTGRYTIRKAHSPQQLSSFEAAAYALAELQWSVGGSELPQLIEAFDAAMLHHQQLMQHKKVTDPTR